MHLDLKPFNSVVKSLYETHYGSSGSNLGNDNAGFDLICPEQIIVPKHARGFKICLQVAAAPSVHYDLRARSSTGSKTPLRLANSVGTMDKSYRGEIIACVDNMSYPPQDFTIDVGRRLFQAVAHDQEGVTWNLVTSLDHTEREDGGFGSTGN